MPLLASPHAIAAEVASGAAVSMFPLVLHFFLGFALAYVTRRNLLAATSGTAWGNPATFPFSFAGAYAVVDWITGGGQVSAAESEALEATGEQLSGGLFAAGLDAIWPTLQR
ncbi:DUF2062 domain-containing protein [Devosia sp. A449]